LSDQRIITTEQGQALATKFGAVFIEASAKTKINVDQIFHELVRQIAPTIDKKAMGGKGGAKGGARRGCTLL